MESSDSCLKCSFHALHTTVQGALEKEVGSKCFHGFFFFLTFLLPWKLSPLCGVFTEALEVDSNPESVSILNCIFFFFFLMTFGK